MIDFDCQQLADQLGVNIKTTDPVKQNCICDALKDNRFADKQGKICAVNLCSGLNCAGQPLTSQQVRDLNILGLDIPGTSTKATNNILLFGGLAVGGFFLLRSLKII